MDTERKGSTVVAVCLALAMGLPLVAIGASIALAIVTGALRLLGLWG